VGGSFFLAKIPQQTQIPAAPFPIVIAGTLVNRKENYLTIGAFGGMSMQPPVIYIPSLKTHYTNIGIKETGYFSINLPPARLVLETDYCGLVSGWKIDKSQLFAPFYGKEKLAPMVRECPVNAVCKLKKPWIFPTMMFSSVRWWNISWMKTA